MSTQQQQQGNMSFTDFLDAMKDPKASDLVRSIKIFIRNFEEQQKKRRRRLTSESEALQEDGVMVQEFVERMQGIMYGHVLWKDGALIRDAVEGLEKYVMSKIWGTTFGTADEDRDKDERYKRLCDALEFLDLHTVIGDGVVFDETVIDSLDACVLNAQEHMSKMDRYKAPRDKLLCLVNVQKILEDGIEGVNSNSFGGADAFFPLMILTVVRTKPPCLCSNIEYIRRFRGRRMSGKFDFMLSYLESAAMYLDTVDWKDLKISQDEFLARLTKAGIPEAELQLNAVKDKVEDLKTIQDRHGKGMKQEDLLIDLIDGSTTPIKDNTGPLSPIRDTEELETAGQVHNAVGSNLGETFNSVKALIEEGTPLVLHEESEGLLQQKFPWIYANAGDLRVGEVAQLLSDYRDLVLQHEALKLALRDHLPIVSSAGASQQESKLEQPTRMTAVSDAAGSLMQKLSLYGWKRDQTPAADGTGHQQPTLLHSFFGRAPNHPNRLTVPSEADATPTSGLSPVVGIENTPILKNPSSPREDSLLDLDTTAPGDDKPTTHE
jgi:Rab5 GDP/GTP exchange factor